MPRSENAQLSVDLYEKLRRDHNWSSDEAWKGIARLLLTCKRWIGKGFGWQDFHGVVVYRETNDFGHKQDGEPNATLRRGHDLNRYLAEQLSIEEDEVCKEIAQYWGQPEIEELQPHNLVGNAFRSIVVNILETYGDSEIDYYEEVNPHNLFPGHDFSSRSKDPRIDIVAKRRDRVVALISSRWSLRHDRVEVIEEAREYRRAASQRCKYYPVMGEFDIARLEKVLKNAPPRMSNPAINAAVHFAPQLITEGIDASNEQESEERLRHLKDLDFLIQETHSW